ncbi:hypothetical protein GALMADRAFT_58125 [Galerina marginata CBS 339.88]|uniref:Geranylgeranyl pyrophosphate synthetase n=1 Tax=Galerina marginata (strain CBS 339.88) TaxID=685588 RepID=A0A067TU91_GALM3|nr:hypothetical protein GALMADRAFT_58125 [Galerina marginata CBS 339.88]
MLNTPYQSPWRGSIVMAPSGRNFTPGNFKARPGSFSPRSSLGSSTHEALPPDLDIKEGLIETPLQAIPIPTSDRNEEDSCVKNCIYIGSYNWLKGDAPAILVPGSPPHWENRATHYTIPPDIGVYLSNQNGHKMPNALFLPLIVAVNQYSQNAKKPPFDWASVDIVTDRNCLRKLTRWVGGNNVRDFRIDLQLVGEKTVLMNRWEKRNMEVFSGRTFGFSFEKASTSPAPGCKDSTGHHRIVTYDLNGLKMVVRFEVDACIPPVAKYPRKSISTIDELTDSMNSIKISPASRVGQLQIFEGGSAVSHTAVVELTTRSQKNIMDNGFDWKEAYPQLFFSQTAHHFLAVHQRGRFIDIQKRKITSEELQAIEKDAQVELKKVRKALEFVQQIAIEHGKKGRISLVCIDGELKVYQRHNDESCLPEQIMNLFESS